MTDLISQTKEFSYSGRYIPDSQTYSYLSQQTGLSQEQLRSMYASGSHNINWDMGIEQSGQMRNEGSQREAARLDYEAIRLGSGLNPSPNSPVLTKASMDSHGKVIQIDYGKTAYGYKPFSQIRYNVGVFSNGVKEQQYTYEGDVSNKNYHENILANQKSSFNIPAATTQDILNINKRLKNVKPEPISQFLTDNIRNFNALPYKSQVLLSQKYFEGNFDVQTPEGFVSQEQGLKAKNLLSKENLFRSQADEAFKGIATNTELVMYPLGGQTKVGKIIIESGLEIFKKPLVETNLIFNPEFGFTRLKIAIGMDIKEAQHTKKNEQFPLDLSNKDFFKDFDTNIKLKNNKVTGTKSVNTEYKIKEEKPFSNPTAIEFKTNKQEPILKTWVGKPTYTTKQGNFDKTTFALTGKEALPPLATYGLFTKIPVTAFTVLTAYIGYEIATSKEPVKTAATKAGELGAYTLIFKNIKSGVKPINEIGYLSKGARIATKELGKANKFMMENSQANIFFDSYNYVKDSYIKFEPDVLIIPKSRVKVIFPEVKQKPRQQQKINYNTLRLEERTQIKDDIKAESNRFSIDAENLLAQEAYKKDLLSIFNSKEKSLTPARQQANYARQFGLQKNPEIMQLIRKGKYMEARRKTNELWFLNTPEAKAESNRFSIDAENLKAIGLNKILNNIKPKEFKKQQLETKQPQQRQQQILLLKKPKLKQKKIIDLDKLFQQQLTATVKEAFAKQKTKKFLGYEQQTEQITILKQLKQRTQQQSKTKILLGTRQQTGQRLKTIQILKTKQRQKQIQIVSPIQIQAQRQGQETISLTKQISIQSQITSQAQRQIQSQAQKQLQAQISIQEQNQRQRQERKSFFPSFPITEPPTDRLPLPLVAKQKSYTKPQPSYLIQVREGERKTDRYITQRTQPMPKNEATNRLLNILDNTEARAGRLIRKGTTNQKDESLNTNILYKFTTPSVRSKKLALPSYVEKRQYALDTLGEQIGVRKGISPF